MEISNLKSRLLIAIKKYNGKQATLGEIRIGYMAQDCFDAIHELETEITALQEKSERLKNTVRINAPDAATALVNALELSEARLTITALQEEKDSHYERARSAEHELAHEQCKSMDLKQENAELIKERNALYSNNIKWVNENDTLTKALELACKFISDEVVNKSSFVSENLLQDIISRYIQQAKEAQDAK